MWSHPSYKFIDGLGRVRKTKTPGTVAGQWIVSDVVEYNNRGFVRKSYLPYTVTSAGTDCNDAGSSAQMFTEIADVDYDALGRPLKIKNTDGTYIQKIYSGWDETVIDGKGKAKDYIKDSYGRIIEVHEHNGSEEYITKYSYDELNNLIQITNSKGQITTISYDNLSRKTAMIDPQMGSWKYEYDANGNLGKTRSLQ